MAINYGQGIFRDIKKPVDPEDQAKLDRDEFNRLAKKEKTKREALGQQQQQQILGFATEQEGRAGDFRKGLAESLASQGRDTFNLMNPSILEDLNSRGLFTSQTARDQSQNQALKEIELAKQGQLSAFDQDTFNNISDIRGTALSALLGGNQSALDSALELRRAGFQRKFDLADQQTQMSFANMLARRQSRDQMVQGLLGFGGNIIGGGLAGGYF